MRISDWSSDVCSSDLFGLGDVLGVPAAKTTAELSAASPAFRTLADTATADIDALRVEMAATGRPLFEVTDGTVGRVLDRRRSEERRAGEECGSTCCSRGAPYH